MSDGQPILSAFTEIVRFMVAIRFPLNVYDSPGSVTFLSIISISVMSATENMLHETTTYKWDSIACQSYHFLNITSSVIGIFAALSFIKTSLSGKEKDVILLTASWACSANVSFGGLIIYLPHFT